MVDKEGKGNERRWWKVGSLKKEKKKEKKNPSTIQDPSVIN